MTFPLTLLRTASTELVTHFIFFPKKNVDKNIFQRFRKPHKGKKNLICILSNFVTDAQHHREMKLQDRILEGG